jgi:hypothetical protein
MAHVGALPKVSRYITGHNDKGQAIFSNAFDEESKMKANDDGIAFAKTSKYTRSISTALQASLYRAGPYFDTSTFLQTPSARCTGR